ncbi:MULTISPECIES: hypothetical protein [Pseudomonas]|uniref:hypothetical protein n=1 Tax=Pseudomonas TaxID=286 RepID=UPI001CE3F971|nr:hypothetical protein [Pseudomonas sp. Marseille-P9655]
MCDCLIVIRLQGTELRFGLYCVLRNLGHLLAELRLLLDMLLALAHRFQLGLELLFQAVDVALRIVDERRDFCLLLSLLGSLLGLQLLLLERGELLLHLSELSLRLLACGAFLLQGAQWHRLLAAVVLTIINLQVVRALVGVIMKMFVAAFSVGVVALDLVGQIIWHSVVSAHVISDTGCAGCLGRNLAKEIVLGLFVAHLETLRAVRLGLAMP